jgi:hypothetical protein
VLVGTGQDGKPISSLRLERVLDGIQDFEYLWLLQNATTYLDAHGQASQAATGLQLLSEVKALFAAPEYLAGQPTNLFSFRQAYYPWSDRYIALHDAIGQELGRLHSAGLT